MYLHFCIISPSQSAPGSHDKQSLSLSLSVCVCVCLPRSLLPETHVQLVLSQRNKQQTAPFDI